MVSKKTLALCALLLLTIAHSTLADIEDDEAININEEENVDDFVPLGTDFVQQEEDYAEKMRTDEEFQERTRNLFIACVVTARNKINSYGDDLLNLLRAVEEKDTRTGLYNKILVEYISACTEYSSHHVEAPKEIMDSLQSNTFKITDWDMMFMQIDLQRYSDPNYDISLSDDEKAILKIVDQFDEIMNKQKKEGLGANEEDDEIPNINGKSSYEPKIGNLSLSDVPLSLQALYFLFIFVLLAAVIFFGYKKISDESEGPIIKKKKKAAKKGE